MDDLIEGIVEGVGGLIVEGTVAVGGLLVDGAVAVGGVIADVPEFIGDLIADGDASVVGLSTTEGASSKDKDEKEGEEKMKNAE